MDAPPAPTQPAYAQINDYQVYRLSHMLCLPDRWWRCCARGRASLTWSSSLDGRSSRRSPRADPDRGESLFRKRALYRGGGCGARREREMKATARGPRAEVEIRVAAPTRHIVVCSSDGCGKRGVAAKPLLRLRGRVAGVLGLSWTGFCCGWYGCVVLAVCTMCYY